MLKIAVCDDDRAQLETAARLLHGYLRARPDLEGQIMLFSDSGELLRAAEEQGGFDLYVLDILMPEQSGIDTGRALRALGDGGEIIYLSSSDEYALDSYDVRAFFYLLKPVEEQRLFCVLDGAVQQLARRRSSAILVHTADGPRRLLLERIRYVERIGRSMRYYCTDGVVDSQSIRTAFKDMAGPLLSDPRFCLCGASFVLNFQHVIGVSGQSALLDDGKTVTLPRASAAEFKRAWGSYWLEESPAW